MPRIAGVELFYTGGSSDKFYTLSMVEESGRYTVSYLHGRRGGTGQSGNKVTAVPFVRAKKAWDDVINEKVGKGYTTDRSGTPYGPANIPVIIENRGITVTTAGSALDRVIAALPTVPDTLQVPGRVERVVNAAAIPQLLNYITEDEVERLLSDPEWGAQEKYDGKRMTLHWDGSKLLSYNKKGQLCGCPESYLVRMAGLSRCIIDGESIGDRFVAYDILTAHGTYQGRWDVLRDMLQDAFEVAPLVRTEAEKRQLMADLKARGGEGIVFKRLASLFHAGKPSSGGDMLKYKFWATAHCRVLRINDKSSIGLCLLDDPALGPLGQWVDVGNCTLSAKQYAEVRSKYGSDSVSQASIVAEIRYLYAYRGGSLYQPNYLGLRDDVDLDECLMTQLKYKGEGTGEKPARRLRFE